MWKRGLRGIRQPRRRSRCFPGSSLSAWFGNRWRGSRCRTHNRPARGNYPHRSGSASLAQRPRRSRRRLSRSHSRSRWNPASSASWWSRSMAACGIGPRAPRLAARCGRRVSCQRVAARVSCQDFRSGAGQPGIREAELRVRLDSGRARNALGMSERSSAAPCRCPSRTLGIPSCMYTRSMYAAAV